MRLKSLGAASVILLAACGGGGGSTPPPTITASVSPPPNDAGWHSSDVAITFSCSANATNCNGPVLISTEGANQTVSGTATGPGGSSSASVIVSIDKTPPAITFLDPPDGQQVFAVNPEARLSVIDDLAGVVSVTCDGADATLSGAVATCTLDLIEGANSSIAIAVDAAGNTDDASIAVTVDLSPRVTIAAAETITASDTVLVEGSAFNIATLQVAGTPVSVQDTMYEATVGLVEGINFISAIAADDSGLEVSATTQVTQDTMPPRLIIDEYLVDATVITPIVDIGGTVNDLIGDAFGDVPTVTVGSIGAEVVNASFLAPSIALVAGDNAVSVSASDSLGNTAIAVANIRYEPPTGHHIEVVSGGGQSGTIGTELSDPIIARVLDADGSPLEGIGVIFRVIQGDGIVIANNETSRAQVVVTGANGLAQVGVQLGSRAGTGNHVVRATAVGINGELRFRESAVANLGNKVNVVKGNNQRAVVGRPLSEPLVIAVTDNGSNLIEGALVTFTVTAGGGKFDNGETSIEVATDAAGRASAKWTLGDLEGIGVQRVTTTLFGTTAFAGFSASGFDLIDGTTTLSGLVLDNQDQPLAGVTVSIDDSVILATTDEHGQFTLSDVPSGDVLLHVDGSTTTEPGEWPALEFMQVIIAGVENPMAAPVYLLPLDMVNAVTVGSENVILTTELLPGFKLEIAADSAIFPDGSTSGVISVTPVNSNKVPMPPPNGMQPQVIVTIQPAGVVFDPPARLTLPNVDGHRPGAQVELYSFDHDIEEFVTIGLGTVSADGALIESNAGVGVLKAGWHCGSPPGDTGCTQSCAACLTCEAPECVCNVVDDTNVPPDDNPGDCGGFACDGGNPISVIDDDDVPPDVLLGDCSSPACDGGVQISAVNDLDVPPDDNPGDCGGVACDGGNPISVIDDGDIPADSMPGDCQSPQCSGGVLDESATNDMDKPDDEPGDCTLFGCVDGMITMTADILDAPDDAPCVSTFCAGTTVVVLPDPFNVPDICNGCCSARCSLTKVVACEPQNSLCGINEVCVASSGGSCTCALLEVLVETTIEFQIITTINIDLTIINIPITISPAPLTTVPLLISQIGTIVDGQIAVALAVGNYEILLEPPAGSGLAVTTTTLEIANSDDGTVKLLSVAMSPGFEVSGEVTFNSGDVVFGAEVDVLNAVGVSIYDGFPAPTTDENGLFAVFLPDGDFTIQISSPIDIGAPPIERTGTVSGASIDFGTVSFQ